MKHTKVKLLRSIGSDDATFKGLSCGLKDCVEGKVIDVTEDEAQQLLAASMAEVPHDVDVPEPTVRATGDGLDDKTVPELHDVARKENINLHGATTSDDIKKAIRKERKK